MSSQSMLLNNVNCSRNDFIHILQCSYSTIINSTCVNTNSYDATVNCCEFVIKILCDIIITMS